MQHQLSAVGGRILLADRYACANDPALCAHGLVVPETSGGRTQWHRLSAPDTCLLVPSGLQSQMAGIFCFALLKLFASLWTARWSSIVDEAIKLACVQ